jgi:SAM-dependent methyltransferase
VAGSLRATLRAVAARARGKPGLTAPADASPASSQTHAIAYDPELVPPLPLMRTEGIDVLEDWFRWAEEWSLILRIYGGLRSDSNVLEIGCGLGRTAFPLRYALIAEGTYDGFEIAGEKVEFLTRTFEPAYPNFRFKRADVYNAYYNPSGSIAADRYVFPYTDASFDLVYAASVFTHMLPSGVAWYLRESARVLRPNGRCVFSFFLLDHYRRGLPRPLGFARSGFSFDHQLPGHDSDFAIGVPENPEEMCAYRLALVERLAAQARLQLARPALPGMWSGAFDSWVGSQDIIVLEPASGVPDAGEREETVHGDECVAVSPWVSPRRPS